MSTHYLKLCRHSLSPKKIFVAFVFYLNAKSIEQPFRIYILLHIKKITSFVFFACF